MQDSSVAGPSGTSAPQIKTVILELAQRYSTGVYNDTISAALPDTSAATIAKAINELLEDGSLKLYVNKDQVPFYKPSATAESTKSQLKNLKVQEEAVFRSISNAGTKGMWAKDIYSKLQLSKIEQNKILKSLLSKKLIKGIVVPGSKLKCYILNNLDHESTKTNIYWYESQDQLFLSHLNQWCVDYLENKTKTAQETGGGPLMVRNNSYVKASEVYRYITEVKNNTVSLDVANIEHILYTFVLDQKFERIKNSQDEFMYKMTTNWMSRTGIMSSPCCGCPVRSKCGKVGSITSKTCQYFDEWLQN